MELRIFTEPQQGATYEALLAMARRAEDTGFGAFFRSDHYMRIGDGDGRPGPTDAWITLAGLARETARIRLGTLLTPVTFRHPGPLAIAVAQVDQMSGGRVELGLGAGWFKAEHDAYGLAFPPMAERFDRLEEQLEVITGLWRTAEGDRFHYAGSHYSISDSPALPKPAQRPSPPIVLGGRGTTRTPALAAKYADEFNVPFADVAESAAQFARVRAACARAGRDPATILMSNALVLCCGATDAELRRRANAIGRDLDALRANGLAGSPTEIVERIGAYAQAGAQRLYLQVLDLADLEHLDLVAAKVMPEV